MGKNSVNKEMSRENLIVRASVTGILSNILIGGVKVLIGMLASSIAIISEGINNASDALTSVLTLIGSKLAGKHPDEKHPFGYGRVEYLTSLVIAGLILVTGVEMIKSSIECIIEPQPLGVSYFSIAIVFVSAIAKFTLGTYMAAMGRKAESSSLIAVGIDSRNDSFVSLVTIVSSLIFLIFDFSIDAYAGIIMSLFILRSGFEVLKNTIGDILGRPFDKDLALKIYREIITTDGILGAADMKLHNYGPDKYSGSVNVEIDHEMNVGDIYQFIHKLQLRIMHEYDVTLVFGIYAVDNDHEEVKELRKVIRAFTKSQEHVKSFHAVYLEPETNKIYCDFIVDYAIRDWDALRGQFLEYMAEKYPDSDIELTIETEFVG